MIKYRPIPSTGTTPRNIIASRLLIPKAMIIEKIIMNGPRTAIRMIIW